MSDDDHGEHEDAMDLAHHLAAAAYAYMMDRDFDYSLRTTDRAALGKYWKRLADRVAP